MKTDNKTRIEILRKAADNLENNKNECHDIQFYSKVIAAWVNAQIIDSNDFDAFKFRIKPQAITLRNGVTIPKPLDVSEICTQKYYYIPLWGYELHNRMTGYDVEKLGYKAYKTKEEAIEASKALFGIE